VSEHEGEALPFGPAGPARRRSGRGRVDWPEGAVLSQLVSHQRPAEGQLQAARQEALGGVVEAKSQV